MNDHEIVVGRHCERRRVLRVAQEELAVRGAQCRSYAPQNVSLSDPSMEFGDIFRSENLTIHMGEQVELTSCLRLTTRIVPTNARGNVVSLHATYAMVRFDEYGTCAVPITGKIIGEEHDIHSVTLGLRPSIVSTVHSFQGRAGKKQYVISLETLLPATGFFTPLLAGPGRESM